MAKMRNPEEEKKPEESGQEEMPLEEQRMHRQSAPRPTVADELQRLGMANQQPDGVMDGFRVLEEVIGREEVQEASQILQKYKQGKANLERRIVENEQWYKLRHWEYMRRESKGENSRNQVEPVSAWLFNSIANKHADAMDNFPSPNILPREEGDKGEAQMLSSIIPVILDNDEFEATYDELMDDKLKSGTGVYGVFWDQTKLNGLGDISVKRIDIINLFWEPGITDIQKSRNFFHVELRDNDLLAQEYPQLAGKLGQSTLDLTQYVYDDTVDTTEKSAVVDWYYKKYQNGRTVLHFCKFVNDTVLFATENDPKYRDRGWYDHGKYPFVFDRLFKLAGTPCGFGYIDVGKSVQEYIDRGGQAIMQNMLANARPRHFIRSDGEVNEQEYADMTKDFVHVGGTLGQDSILPIQGKPLSSIYLEVLNNKVDELKETTGNRDISTGGTSGGVTAASALAAMQEAGSKLSRDSNKGSYRGYKQAIQMTLELVRQFYDLPRCFRIIGENGAYQFIQYSNSNIRPQYQGNEMGQDMGYRTPLFDVEISAQKASPYSKLSQNEMALQFYSAGFFNPQMADQALACLEMMDFDRKNGIMERIARNGTMFQRMVMMQQQMIQMATIIDRTKGTNMAEQIASGIIGAPVPAAAGSGKAAENAKQTEALGGDSGTKESSTTKNARQRVAESTSPK